MRLLKLSSVAVLAWWYVALCVVDSGVAQGQDTQKAEITFYKDVYPILQTNCAGCHRPGEIGPMPLRSYSEVRPWAKAIKQAVILRKMPPWFADRTLGHFRNDPSLSEKQIETLAGWADGGALEGDSKEAPEPRTYVEGWNIGSPDFVVEMPKAYEMPATGTVEYTYIIVPSGLTEDRWITAAEYRPENRGVVHHASVWARPPESRWLRQYPTGEFFVPKEQIRTATSPRPAATTNAGATLLDLRIASYVPGRSDKKLPDGYGVLIPAGSDIVFQLHYTSNGKTGTDRSRVGFVFAKTPPQKRVLSVAAFNDSFVIPPATADYAVSGSVELNVDAELLEVSPHMHLRGKSVTLSAQYPTNHREELLRVPNYDFNWQLFYRLDDAKSLPKGTVLKADAVFDNSANNPHNPDPKAEVRWGDQSWEEMMVGFFVVAVPAATPPWAVFKLR
jgi:hypothetical protein